MIFYFKDGDVIGIYEKLDFSKSMNEKLNCDYI